MGAQVSLPRHLVPLARIDDILSGDAELEASDDNRDDEFMSVKTVMSAWKTMTGIEFETVHPINLHGFDANQCYVVLRLYDRSALESNTFSHVSLSPSSVHLCLSAVTALNRADICTPLHSASFGNLGCNVFMWPGLRSTPSCRALALSRATELAKAMSCERAEPLVRSIWTTTLCAWPKQSMKSMNAAIDVGKLAQNELLIACLDPLTKPAWKQFDITISKECEPSCTSKSSDCCTVSKLDLAKVNQSCYLGDAECDKGPSMKMTQLHIDHSMSEEQQKMASLDFCMHSCSEIVPGVFVAGDSVARNRQQLAENGITHVINAAADVCSNYFPNDLSYITLYLLDSRNEDISCVLYDVLEFISSVLASGGSVLVHCHRGISRSTTLVIAFLLLKTKMSVEEAFAVVKKQRQISSPNIGFYFSLIQWKKRLDNVHEDSVFIYRVAPHRPSKNVFTLVAHLEPADVLKDCRGVYVIQTPEAVFVWKGSQSTELLWKYANEILIPRLQRFEHAPTNVVAEMEGNEDDAFLARFGSGHTRCKKFDAEYSRRAKELYRIGFDARPEVSQTPRTTSSSSENDSFPRKRERTGSLKLPDDVAPKTARSPGYQFSTTEETSERSVPLLFELPSWKEIATFDPEDLNDALIFALVQKTPPVVHVWFGEDVDDNDYANTANAIAEEAVQRLQLSRSCKVIVQTAGNETDEFWDMF